MLKSLLQIFILSCITLFLSSSLADFASNQQAYEYQHLRQMLNSKPSKNHHDNIGITIYHKMNDRIFILLGRENSKSNDLLTAGKFGPFGGFATTDLSYVDNMCKYLREGSLATIQPNTNYIIECGAFLIKKLENKKNTYPKVIINAIIPAIENYYIPASTLNELYSKQQASLTPGESRKDLFAWFDLEDIIDGAQKRAINYVVHDIEGQTHKVRFTHTFIEDFIKHPDIKSIIRKIKMQG